MNLLKQKAKLLTAALLGAAVLSSCSYKTDGAAFTPYGQWKPKPHNKEIIGYYAGWTLYARNGLMKPMNLKPHLGKWTRFTFAFMHADPQGNIWLTDSYADADVLFGPSTPAPSADTKVVCVRANHPRLGKDERCFNKKIKEGLVELAHAQGVEVWPSIGGWTLSDVYPKIAASATARANFAHSCVNLLREYNMDGIDIDWEYPGYTDHSGTPQDKDNYVLFMQAIKDSITAYGKTVNRKFKLTGALGCGAERIKVSYDVPKLVKIMDEFNLMTYDFHGHWDPIAGHNSGLFENTSPRTGFSVATCAEDFMRAGVPANRLSVGAGFYGRGVVAKDLNAPITKDSTRQQILNSFGEYALGVDFAHWPTYEGSPLYWNILQKKDELDFKWDDVAKVPYATFKDGSGFVSYEDTTSMRIRANWVKKSGVNGVIVWEVSGDVIPVEDTVTTFADVKKELAYTPKLVTPLIDVLSDHLNGKYANVIPTELKAKPKQEVKVEEPKVVEQPKVDISAMKQKAKIALRGVNFASGKAELLASSSVQLDEVVQGLLDNPEVVVEISGHTDNVGKPKKNEKLSLDRANSVKVYLLSKGVKPEQVQVKGYGPNKPVASNKTAEGKAQNRRIEMMRIK